MKKTNDERLLNDGVTISTKQFGDVTVREFSFRQLNFILRTIAKIFKQVNFDSQDADKDIAAWLFENLENVDVADNVLELLAVAINKKKEELADISLNDGLALIDAVVEVNDWGNIRKLFFRIAGKLQTQK